MITFPWLIIFEISDVRVVSVDTVLCIFNGTIFYSLPVSLLLEINLEWNYLFSLKFNINVGKREYVLTWEILSNRNISIELVTWLQARKNLVYNIWMNWFKLYINHIQGWAKNKGPIHILYHNSALRYAIALNFGRTTTSIALNSNWHNLAWMLLCNVFWKLFHIWYLLACF